MGPELDIINFYIAASFPEAAKGAFEVLDRLLLLAESRGAERYSSGKVTAKMSRSSLFRTGSILDRQRKRFTALMPLKGRSL